MSHPTKSPDRCDRTLDLFEPRTMARTSDPSSSHEAARAIVESGGRAAQAAAVLEALRVHGKSTSRGLSQASGIDRHVVARRLPELEREGRVRRTEQILCPWAGRLAVGWIVT